MSTALQILFSKGVEWRYRAPVYILSAHIACVFDNVTVSILDKAMRFWGVPHDIMDALLRETQGVQGTAVLSGLSTPPFDYTKLRQGGPESTTLFNLVIRIAIARAASKWQHLAASDLPLVGSLHHVVFADNVSQERRCLISSPCSRIGSTSGNC